MLSITSCFRRVGSCCFQVDLAPKFAPGSLLLRDPRTFQRRWLEWCLCSGVALASRRPTCSRARKRIDRQAASVKFRKARLFLGFTRHVSPAVRPVKHSLFSSVASPKRCGICHGEEEGATCKAQVMQMFGLGHIAALSVECEAVGGCHAGCSWGFPYFTGFYKL